MLFPLPSEDRTRPFGSLALARAGGVGHGRPQDNISARQFQRSPGRRSSVTESTSGRPGAGKPPGAGLIRAAP